MLWFILIGIAAGFLAGQLVKGGGFGVIGNLVVGVLGAIIGGWLVKELGFFPANRLVPQLLTATGGAVVLLSILNLIKR